MFTFVIIIDCELETKNQMCNSGVFLLQLLIGISCNDE